MFNSALPNSAAALTKYIVNQTIRLFLRLVALVWLALGMSVPVSAWAIHDAAHGAAQVSLDAHHHHDDDGGISLHDHDEGEAPDGGHDHMPSVLLCAVTVPQTGVSLNASNVVRQIYTSPPSRGVERHASDGLRRPPRHG